MGASSLHLYASHTLSFFANNISPSASTSLLSLLYYYPQKRRQTWDSKYLLGYRNTPRCEFLTKYTNHHISDNEN